MENIDTTRPIVLGLLRQAWRFREKCDHSRATVFYRAAIAADQTPLAKIEYAAFVSLENMELAEELLLQSWEIAKCQNNSLLVAQACQNLSCIYRELRDDTRARQFQQLAISAELKAIDRGQAEMVSLECRLGLMLDDQLSGDAFAEQDLYRQLEGSADLDVRLTLHLNLAMLSFQRGDLPQSVRHARAAVGAALKLEQPSQLLESLHLLGRLLINDGRWHEATACMRHAADWANVLGRSELAEQIRRNISTLRSQMHRLTADPARN